jgi:hypothetical protein
MYCQEFPGKFPVSGTGAFQKASPDTGLDTLSIRRVGPEFSAGAREEQCFSIVRFPGYKAFVKLYLAATAGKVYRIKRQTQAFCLRAGRFFIPGF